MNIHPDTAKEWLDHNLISADDYKALTKSVKGKYHAVQTDVDGIKFHSEKEANRYSELNLREKAGEIRDLKLQVKFPLIVNDIKIADYICDFQYLDLEKGDIVVEDVKGMKKGAAYTIFKIKAKLVLAIYGIKVLET